MTNVFGWSYGEGGLNRECGTLEFGRNCEIPELSLCDVNMLCVRRVGCERALENTYRQYRRFTTIYILGQLAVTSDTGQYSMS